jgi:hypothetical protein
LDHSAWKAAAPGEGVTAVVRGQEPDTRGGPRGCPWRRGAGSLGAAAAGPEGLLVTPLNALSYGIPLPFVISDLKFGSASSCFPFLFCLETGSYYVALASLEFPVLSSAGIISTPSLFSFAYR